jgi:hypothetical protein
MHNDWVRQRFMHSRLSPDLPYLPNYLLSIIIVRYNWDFICEGKDWDMYFICTELDRNPIPKFATTEAVSGYGMTWKARQKESMKIYC